MSCSASEAAAGSPVPPTEAHVDWSNWYLPRYVPSGLTAVGSPPDSHEAIDSSGADAVLAPTVAVLAPPVAAVPAVEALDAAAEAAAACWAAAACAAAAASRAS